MKVYILLLAILFTLLCIIYYYCKNSRVEGLELPMSAYINPKADQTLRDPMHLPATVYRVTNTILTAANVFSDKMDKLPLPDNIKDAYNEWIDKGLVSPIKDQMLCGGCWAFATCSSLADRLSIATNGRWYPPFGLSEQILISCGGDMNMQFYQGCEGGIPHFAIDALTKEGVPADSKCLICGGRPGATTGEGDGTQRNGGVVNPNNTTTCSTGGDVYAATNYTWWQTGCNGATSCSLAPSSTCGCAGITAQMKQVEDKTHTPFDVKYKTVGEAHNYTAHGKNNELHTVDLWPDIPQSVIDANVIRMKKAIYYEGPITVGYRVTSDFYTFWPTSGLDNYYKYDGRSPMAGGHAVVIVGWRKMNDGTPVWIVKNSWGANGGYGFPMGAKWVDPVTGKSKIKYLGGFWNHIMGINDSFIESNASGAHPNLMIPEISKHLPDGGKGIPENWYETMTLRQIYQMSVSKPPPISPPPVTPLPEYSPPVTPLPEYSPPPVTPLPEYSPLDIQSNKFTVVTLTPDNITPGSLEEFFRDPQNLYLVGSHHTKAINQIITFLPNKDSLSEEDIKTLIKNVSENVQGYVVIATKGDTNNYYYMDGDPVDWKGVFNKTFVNRAATMKKFTNEIFAKLQGLELQAPVVQLSKKI